MFNGPVTGGIFAGLRNLDKPSMARAETAWGKVVLDQAEPERPFEESDPRSNGSLGGF